MMKRFFNVAGPCLPERHYMIEPRRRCASLWDLVERETYFVIHAARQSGKTTLLLEFVKELEKSDQYYALYCPLEIAQAAPSLDEGIRAIISRLSMAVERHHALSQIPPIVAETARQTMLLDYIARLCSASDRPVVVLFDEADCLSGDVLVSFLRQLRDGYVSRSLAPFAHSVGLVGMRNLRDYKAHVRPDSETLGSASPFNIITKALTIRNFSRDEVAELYAQHTADTGQAFPPEAVDAAWSATRGQPWLVNAIAREIVEEILERDASRAIEPAHVAQACQAIILRRDTHIDSLMERLREPRVQEIIEPVIIGESGDMDPLMDNFQYVRDLGIVDIVDGVTRPANPIYAEVILRTLNYRTQFRLAEEQRPYALPRYLKDGRIDMRFLLGEFQQFWRENSEVWSQVYTYKEAAPHLILMAFLQRVANQKATLHREFAAGRGRLDVCIEYEGLRYPIEIKLLRGPKTVEQGFEQLGQYMDTLGCREGWLLVFDRDPNKSRDEKIFWNTATHADKTIHHLGL